MQYIFTLFSLCILTVAYGQSPDSTRNTFTAEVKIFEKFDGSSHPIPVKCITVTGDTLDLAAYIVNEIQYPEYCIEMYISGTSYYQCTVNQQGKADSLQVLKKLFDCSTQVAEEVKRILYGLQKVLYPPGNSMDIMLRIEAFPRKPEAVKTPVITPVYKEKNKRLSRKKNRQSR